MREEALRLEHISVFDKLWRVFGHLDEASRMMGQLRGNWATTRCILSYLVPKRGTRPLTCPVGRVTASCSQVVLRCAFVLAFPCASACARATECIQQALGAKRGKTMSSTQASDSWLLSRLPNSVLENAFDRVLRLMSEDAFEVLMTAKVRNPSHLLQLTEDEIHTRFDVSDDVVAEIGAARRHLLELATGKDLPGRTPDAMITADPGLVTSRQDVPDPGDRPRSTAAIPLTDAMISQLSPRARRALRVREVRTVDALCALDDENLLRISNVGVKTVAELRRFQIELARQLENGDAGRLQKPEASSEKLDPGTAPANSWTSESPIPDDMLAGLSARALRVLRKRKVETVEGLLRLNDSDMRRVGSVGNKTVLELKTLQTRLSAGRIRGAEISSGDSTAPASVQCISGDAFPKHSMLNQPIGILASADPVDGVYLTATSSEPLLSHVGLPDSDLQRFRGIGVFAEDPLYDVLSISLELALIADISESALCALVAYARSAGMCGHYSWRPWAPDSRPCIDLADGEYVSNFSVECFGLAQRDINVLADLGVSTVWDAMGLSEKDILDRGGISLSCLQAIRALWSLRARAVELSRRIGDHSYSSAHQLVEMVMTCIAPDSRQRNILNGRLGLTEDGIVTLEALGRQEELTRERVRQIERSSLRRLTSASLVAKLAPLRHVASFIIGKQGGVASCSEAIGEMCECLSWKPTEYEQGVLALLLSGTEGIRADESRSLLMVEGHPCLTCEEMHRMLDDSVETHRILTLDDAATELSRRASSYCTLCLGRPKEFSRGYVEHVTGTLGFNIADGKVFAHTDWLMRFGSQRDVIETILRRAGRPMHFTEVVDEARSFGRELSERYVHGTLSNSPNVMLWGRGSFLHSDHVTAPVALLTRIADDIAGHLSGECPMVSVAGFYSAGRDELQAAGIPTDQALYSCIRALDDPRLRCTDYPWIIPASKAIRPTLDLVLEHKIGQYEDGMPAALLEQYLLETLRVNPQMIPNYLCGIPRVVRCGKDTYAHSKFVGVAPRELEPIRTFIDAMIEEHGHVSVDRVLEANQVTCRQLGITSRYTLYDLLRTFFASLYSLPRIPYIGSNSEGARSASDEIARFIRQMHGPCSADELKEHFVRRLGYNTSTALNAHYYEGVVRYALQLFIHLDTLEWDDEKQRIVEDAARQHCEARGAAGYPFGLVSVLLDDPGLPALPGHVVWTPTLLSDLLSRRGAFCMIGDAQEAFLPDPNPDGIRDLQDLVRLLLEREYSGAVSLSTLQGDLREAGVIRGSPVQTMLGCGTHVQIVDGVVMLAELAEGVEQNG